MSTLLPGTPDKVLNIAHRGARAYAPENTLAAFAKAKTMGCDMFEMDVRLSKDGVVIVHHDESLHRCTNAEAVFSGRSSYQVDDFTYDELRQLDAGSWYIQQLALEPEQRIPFLQTLTEAERETFITSTEYDQFASGNIKIPTLAETLSLAKQLGIQVNVEFKHQNDGGALLVPAVLSEIKAMQMEDQILISSFEHDMLRQVKQQSNSIATAILTDKPMRAPIGYLRKLKASAYNLGCFREFASNGFNDQLGISYLQYLNKLRQAGFAINIWTCNDPVEMKALLTAGVTGLISDYPNRVNEQIWLLASASSSSKQQANAYLGLPLP